MPKSKERNLRVLIIPLVLVLAAVVACAVYTGVAVRQAEEQVYRTAKEAAAAQILTLNASMEGRFTTLEAYARCIAADEDFGFTAEKTLRQLGAVQDGTYFFEMFVIDGEGIAHLTDGRTFAIGDRAYIQRAFSGRRAIEYLTMGRIDTEPHFTLAVPLTQDGQVIGAAAGTFKKETFRKLLYTEAFGGVGDSFISTPDGQILLGLVQSDTAEKSNFLENIDIPENAEIIDQLRADFASATAGDATVRFNDMQYYIVYSPAGVNDWMVASVIPGSVVEASVEEATRVSFLVTGVVSLVSLLLLLFIAAADLRAKRIIERERDELGHKSMQLDLLVRSTPGGVFQYSAEADERFQFVSESMLQLLGYTQGEFEKKFSNRFSLMVYADDRARVLREIDEQIAGGEYDFCEYRIERKDGSLLWVHDVGHIVTDADGKRWFYVVIVDISAQKEAEEALRERSEENAAVIRQSGKSVIRYNVRTREANHFGGIVQELDLPAHMENVPASILERDSVLPESRGALQKMFDDINGGSAEGSCNLHLMNAARQKRWYRADYTLLTDAAGAPSFAILSLCDNTEQLEKELAYEKLKNEMNASIAESAAYYEINLTQNVVERAEGMVADRTEHAIAGMAFSAFLQKAAGDTVAEDRSVFTEFFNVQRLLSFYAKGGFEDEIEYRSDYEGAVQWYRAEVQMVRNPYTGDVKAFLTIENTDAAHQQTEQLTERASRDALTGLYNRATLDLRIREALAAMRPEDDGALLMMDLDNFKNVNDTKGHQAGDEALRHTGAAISDTFRRDDVTGRFGGDEFMVFLPRGATRKLVVEKMETLRRAIAVDVQGVPVTASIGAVLFRGGERTQEALYADADMALYRAKRAGKNQSCIL